MVKSGTKLTWWKVDLTNKNTYKEYSNEKVVENRPPKSGHSDSQYNFEKKKKSKLKKDPLKFKKLLTNKNTYKEYSN